VKGFLKGSCVHCGGHIEFPGSAIDTVVPCPHCGNQTVLRFDQIEDHTEDADEGNAQRMLIIALIILVVALGAIAGGYYYLKSKTSKSGIPKKKTETQIAPVVSSKPKSDPAKATSEPKLAMLNFETVPDTNVDADPAKHRFPLEAARRSATGEIRIGRQVFLGHCSECHVFYDPAMYSADQWPQLLNKMEGKAKLGRDEREKLEKFMATIRAPGT
jgi:hypothetical protein